VRIYLNKTQENSEKRIKQGDKHIEGKMRKRKNLNTKNRKIYGEYEYKHVIRYQRKI
jgi:hypothetical protein